MCQCTDVMIGSYTVNYSWINFIIYKQNWHFCFYQCVTKFEVISPTAIEVISKRQGFAVGSILWRTWDVFIHSWQSKVMDCVNIFKYSFWRKDEGLYCKCVVHVDSITLTPDLQTRLSSSESELLISKSRIDQLERENAGEEVKQWIYCEIQNKSVTIHVVWMR